MVQDTSLTSYMQVPSLHRIKSSWCCLLYMSIEQSICESKQSVERLSVTLTTVHHRLRLRDSTALAKEYSGGRYCRYLDGIEDACEVGVDDSLPLFGLHAHD